MRKNSLKRSLLLEKLKKDLIKKLDEGDFDKEKDKSDKKAVLKNNI